MGGWPANKTERRLEPAGRHAVQSMLMKKTLIALTLTLAGALCASAAPNLFTYQGRLKEGGLAVTGNRTVEIFLCNAETGPTCTTTQPQPVAVTNGLFRSTFTIPSSLDLGTGGWWLEIKIGANTLAPREQLASNAYALFAATAAYAQGVSAAPGSNGVYISTNLYVTGGGKFVGDGSALTNLPVSGGAVAKAGDTMTGSLSLLNASTLTVAGGAFSVGGATLAVVGGKVGIGTAGPGAPLEVMVGNQGLSALKLSNSGNAVGMEFWPYGIQTLSQDFYIRGGGGQGLSLGSNGQDNRIYVRADGNVGVGTTAPSSKFDVMDGSITVRGANAALVFEDSRRVISSETATAAGAGIRVSTNVYIVGFSSAAKYYGDGSALTNLPAAGGGVAKAGDTMTGSLSLLNASTLTVAGSEFSVGASTFMVTAGAVGINMPPGTGKSLAIAPKFGDTDGLVEIYNSAGKFAQLRMRGTPALDLATGLGGGGIQLSPGGSSLVYLKPGMVGINVSVPSAMLHVESGSVTITGALAAYPYVLMAGDNGIVISTGGAITTTGIGNGAVSGNPRGTGAADLQTSRDNAAKVASGNYSSLGGGLNNASSGYASAVGGGQGNSAGSNSYTTVAGGMGNSATLTYAAVGGGNSNVAGGYRAFVGGGGTNKALEEGAAVLGGQYNNVSSSNSAIGGGMYNTVTGTSAVIAGGEYNTAGGMWAGVTNGRGNAASGNYSAVGGGSNNAASSDNAFIGGGTGNSVSGSAAAIIAGSFNIASGHYSLAGGYKGKASAMGAFTWTDGANSGAEFTENAVQNRTLFKNRGGFLVSGSTNTNMTGLVDRGMFVSGNGLVGIATGAPQAALDVVANGQPMAPAQIWRDSGGIIVASMNAVGVLSAASLTTNGNVGVGTMNPGAKLDIQGPGSGGLDEFAGLRVVNTGFNLNQLVSINLATGNGTILGAIKSKLYNATSYGDLTFWTWSNPNMVQRMIIDNVGNVGINTPAPQAALHVNGNIRVNGPAELGDATAAGNQPAVVWLTNNTGSAVSSGSIVIAYGNNGFNTTTVASTTSVVGVVYDASIAAGAAGRIAVAGVASAFCNTTALVGQHVVASASPGKADSTNSPPAGASIGRWLENCASPGMGRVLLR